MVWLKWLILETIHSWRPCTCPMTLRSCKRESLPLRQRCNLACSWLSLYTWISPVDTTSRCYICFGIQHCWQQDDSSQILSFHYLFLRRSKLSAQKLCFGHKCRWETYISGSKKFQEVGLSSNDMFNDNHETSIFTFPHLNWTFLVSEMKLMTKE